MKKPVEDLTIRQEDVLILVASGYSNEEIGAKLGITPRGAKHHVDTIRLKVGVKHRRQLVGVVERNFTNRRRRMIIERIDRRTA